MEADGAVRSPHGPVYGGGDMDLGLSSDSLDDDDTDSLCEERRYQSELQDRMHSKYEVTLQTKGDTGEPAGEVTSRDTESHQARGAKPNISPREINTSYSELRYDPDWRKHQNLPHTSDDESSIDSPDEMTPDPSDGRDSVDAHPFWKPLTDVASKNKKTAATTKPKSKESGRIRRRGTHQDATDKKTVMAQGETSKKDIIEMNKVTFGVRKEKTQSYLHMHKKKIEESKSGQCDEKSDVQPAEDGSSEGKEEPRAIEQSGSAGGREKTPKTLNMADGSSDINAAQWQTMALFSEDYDHEYMTIPSYPDRYRLGPYSSQELLQIHNEGSYYRRIEPPHMRYDRHAMETKGGEQDSWEMYMYPRLSQGALTQPDPPGITYSTHNVSIPNQITPQTYAPMAKSSRSNSDSSGGDERSRPCPSGVRKTADRHPKRLKSFLNQEVKLGGLGPVHSVSEEKKEQLKQQKEYAKVIQERNRNKPAKPREIQVTQDDNNKSTRQKSLDYAKKVPRPQPVSRVSSQNSADAPEKRAMSYDCLFPQIKLLEDLQVRHEKEKMAVAALNALHIL